MLIMFSLSQTERIFFYIGDGDTFAAMNNFLSIVVIGFGLALLHKKSTVRS